MRKLLSAFCLFLATALVTVQTAQAQELSASKIFNAIGGTTSFDRGGAVHSQARSIYSLGGGMTTFQGKRVSLFAADPPSFSAGCNGISWHFGGFSFISMDEIRRLVEAVAQASVGVAVDLAMQTLCPQCYAVMAKLRDIANGMRNAVADACTIAQNYGAMLSEKGTYSPGGRAFRCSKMKAEAGTTIDVLNGVAGDACAMLSNAETELNKAADKAMSFLSGKPQAGAKTPDRETLEQAGNITFKALTALGYENGPVKDIMLSLLGMSIQPMKSSPDCRDAFKDLAAVAQDELKSDPVTPHTPEEEAALASVIKTYESVDRQVTATTTDKQPTMSDSDTKVRAASPSKGGVDKGPNTCFAPPVLSGVTEVGRMLMCGVNVSAEMRTFAANYFSETKVLTEAAYDKLASTSMGAMCGTVLNKASENPLVYTCRQEQQDCLQPKLVRLKSFLDTNSSNGYTGIVWMVGDALYSGVKKIRDNQPLEPKTKKVLNGSGYPLYRLLNMAAVYPSMTEELLNAYISAIAAQFAMDTFDAVARIGAQPAIGTPSVTGLTPQSVSSIREHIMGLMRGGDSVRIASLERLAEKRKIIEVILLVNKALQAEVIGQGLGGNAKLAVSLKQQVQALGATTP